MKNKDIDPEFYAKNKFILNQPRGAGYWLWKHYIIKDALSRVNDGDIDGFLQSKIKRIKIFMIN